MRWKRTRALVERHPVATFGFLACLWSWGFWIPAVLAMRRDPVQAAPAWFLPLIAVSGPGPTVAGLVLTALLDGVNGLKDLGRKFFVWRVHVGWYLVVLLAPPATLLLAMALGVLMGRSVGPPRFELLPVALLSVGLAIPFGPLMEELGWRGFALPRLQRGYTPLVSSLLVGAMWLVWHVPLFWAPAGAAISGGAVTWDAVASYLAFLTGWSIIFTWVNHNTRGSVLLAILLHAGLNARSVFLLLPDLSPALANELYLLSAIPVWAFALLVVGYFGLGSPLWLHRTQPQTGAGSPGDRRTSS